MTNILLVLLSAVAIQAHGFTNRALLELQRVSARSTPSTTLLGDLATSNANLTSTGSEIASILTGKISAIANPTSYNPPGTQDSPACAADICCIWHYLTTSLHAAFLAPGGGICNSLARGAIRLGFHDAATWNISLPNGGADGSIVLNPAEASRHDNRGLETIIAQTAKWYEQWKTYGIGMADLIQLSAITAVASCPGGPSIKAFVGREDSAVLPPEGLIPSPHAEAKVNIQLFEAKTLSASDLVALLGAHTVSQQFFVDPARAGDAQDTTDGVWDTTFYGETASPVTPPDVFKFFSDVSLSHYPETNGTWQSFGASLELWNAAFASAYFRMSLLGLKNLNGLTDCSKAMPSLAV
ncbi:hypothetical protein N0V93_002048 [Gnomoniopsis smithogilvyi]|uniref:Peroxidase n=1 Tax=Gnomoniopsis smithogilvyi TaxID=1191159 RepID=A0A9W8Z2T3_9PEZI|nr:hypothetical protein N0V93_002048 [Gnomoniopsis smithogilvyi]